MQFLFTASYLLAELLLRLLLLLLVFEFVEVLRVNLAFYLALVNKMGLNITSGTYGALFSRSLRQSIPMKNGCTLISPTPLTPSRSSEIYAFTVVGDQPSD